MQHTDTTCRMSYPFAYRERALYAEEVPLDAIADAYGTPCYVYSRAALEDRFLAFKQAFAGCAHRICYAVKANSNLAILDLMRRLGAGFDIVSGGELSRVLAINASPESVLFSGVGKSSDDIKAALAVGIGCFNVESAAELKRLAALAAAMNRRAAVSLRINPDVDANTHPYITTGMKQNKFGIPFDKALELYAAAHAEPHLLVTGINFHLGSQLTEIAPFIAALERVLLLVDQLEKRHITLQHIDMGGGLGVRYSDETPPSAAALVSAVRERMGSRKLTLLIEPGRSITAQAGVLLTRIEYLKDNGVRYFAIVDAAMNDLLRPALYNAWQRIMPVRERQQELPAVCRQIVGPVCESADFLGLDRSLAVTEGDLLAICDVGAYGFVMSSNYNTRPRAAELLVDGDHVHQIRRRETIEELYALESLPP